MVNLLPWQYGIWDSLTRRVHQAHAYLLHGPAGSGKRQMTEQFANYLLCKTPRNSAACGQCSSCRLFQADSHPDMYRLKPEEQGKGILISHVRELVGSIQQTSQQGGRQVVIVEPAEVMTTESANALLKSLEEPNAGTIFILITHHLSFLLPTIKSRCVLQACPLPSISEAAQWLAQQLPDKTEAQLESLLNLAACSPLKALQFAQDDVQGMREAVVEGVKQLLKRQQAPATLVGQWAKYPPELLLQWFAEWCQDMLRYQLTQQVTDLGTADMQPVLGHMAKFVQPQQLLDTQQWILERRNKLLRRAPLRTDLLFESLLVRWLSLVGQ